MSGRFGEKIGNARFVQREGCFFLSFLLFSFLHKLVHRYTMSKAEQKGLTDYMAMDKSLKRDAMKVKVVRDMSDCSDHFAVFMKLKVRDK